MVVDFTPSLVITMEMKGQDENGVLWTVAKYEFNMYLYKTTLLENNNNTKKASEILMDLMGIVLNGVCGSLLVSLLVWCF